MRLERIVDEGGNVQFVHVANPDIRLGDLHPAEPDCQKYGCVVHNPSQHPLSDAPLNWREDRGIMERICAHGTGHPDFDSANRFERLGQSFQNVHGCDGCCA